MAGLAPEGNGSVKAKISAPVFDSQQILVSREFVGGPTNLQTEVTLGILEGGMKFLAKYFSIPYPWGLLTCKNWGDELSS